MAIDTFFAFALVAAVILIKLGLLILALLLIGIWLFGGRSALPTKDSQPPQSRA